MRGFAERIADAVDRRLTALFSGTDVSAVSDGLPQRVPPAHYRTIGENRRT